MGALNAIGILFSILLLWGCQTTKPIHTVQSDDYAQTIIGRTKRDYVWIMARRPIIPEENYQRLVEFLEMQGYASAKLRRVPHVPSSS